MSKPLKHGLLLWGLGHLIPLLHAVVQKFHLVEDIEAKYLILADGFFVAAVLFLSVGILTLIARTGQYKGLHYSVYLIHARFVPQKSGKILSYKEFLKEHAKEQNTSSVWPVLAPGFYFLGMSFIFNVLFGF